MKLIYSEIKLFNRLICNTYNPNQKKENQSSHSQRCNVDNVNDFLWQRNISNIDNVKLISYQYCIQRNFDDIEKEICIGHE